MDDRTAAARLSDYVRLHAPAAGYQLDRRGEAARLARDADLAPDALSRILKAERKPEPKKLWGLAKALNVRYFDLLAEIGTIPAESVDAHGTGDVASRPVTADDLADQWGAVTPEDRALVQNAFEVARQMIQRRQDERRDTGS